MRHRSLDTIRETKIAPAESGHRVLHLVAIAVLLSGVKLVMINAFATDLPILDQWDAEGRNLIAPYLDRGLGGVEWLALHNVHRILTTRLFALAIFVVNGQWDALVECVFSACLHIACALSLALFVDRQVPAGGARSILISVIVVGFASPYGWENTVGGFQCQFYFLILATLAMLILGSREHKTSTTHLCIVVLGLVSYFSLAGGVFACVAAASCVAFVGASSRRRLAPPEVACVVMLLSTALAGYAFTPRSEAPLGFGVTALLGSFGALHHALSFPTTAGAVFLWAPCLVLLIRTVRHPRAATRLTIFDLGLALFVVLTAVGIASQRGDDLASRYKDILWLGLFANLVAIHELVRSDGTTTKSRLKSAAFAGFAILTSTLLVDDGLRALDQAGERKARFDAAAAHLAAFLRTGDAAAFEARGDRLPHPSAALVELVVSSPKVRAVLPPSIQSSLLDGPHLAAGSDRPAFPGPVEPGRLRRFSDFLLSHAGTILAFGLSAFLVLQVSDRIVVRD